MIRPALVAALSLLAAAPLHAQDAGSSSLGKIKPYASYIQSTIMVAPFNIEQGADTTFETIPRIIRRDLELTGLFKMPADQRLANAQNLTDGRGGGVDFNAWRRLGVDHYLMGRVMREGGNLRVRVLLYDIGSGRLIFERYFTDSVENERRLAHRISDEATLAISQIEGVAQTSILFINEETPGTKEVALMDWDGYNPRRLTKYGSICSSPEWGANGTEIYYGSYKGNRGNVYGMQLTSGQAWTIAAYGGTSHSPSWSQAARRMALVLSRDGNSEIYTCARDGTSLARVTQTPATEGSPSFSPDGKRIAFVSNEGGGVHIYVMNADGSGRTRVTPKGSWNDAPSWSPDGRRIVFTSRIGGVADIYIADLSTNPPEFRRLTQGQGQNGSPCFAPNGRHIVFASKRSGQWQIYLMLDDGTNQRALTTTGRNTSPSWSPQPPGWNK